MHPLRRAASAAGRSWGGALIVSSPCRVNKYTKNTLQTSQRQLIRRGESRTHQILRRSIVVCLHVDRAWVWRQHALRQSRHIVIGHATGRERVPAARAATTCRWPRRARDRRARGGTARALLPVMITARWRKNRVVGHTRQQLVAPLKTLVLLPPPPQPVPTCCGYAWTFPTL